MQMDSLVFVSPTQAMDIFFIDHVRPPLNDYKVIPTRPVVPGDPRWNGAARGGLRIVVAGVHCILRDFAARKGFPRLTVVHLKSLHDFLGVKGSKHLPKAQLVMKLVKYCLPSISDGELRNTLQERELEEAYTPYQNEPSSAAALIDLLQDDEQEDIIDHISAIKARILEETMRDAAARLTMPSVTPAPPDPLRLIAPNSYTQAEAKSFLPPNSYIEKHVSADANYWRVRSDHLATSRSRIFAGTHSDSDFAALRVVLAIVWAAYTRRTGVACPWSLPIESFA